MASLSGYLLANTSGVPIQTRQIVVDEPKRERGPVLRYGGLAFALPWWDALELVSHVPLADEPDQAGPYQYPVFALRGFSKIVLLAERRRIAEFILRSVLDTSFTPRMRKVAVNLDEVVRYCQDGECEYLITSLTGRFAGPARQLRVISLYGDDVTDSAIFRDHRHVFNVTTCGFGRRHLPGLPTIGGGDDGEILRLGNDGSITAILPDRNRAMEFVKAIRFVVDHDWIERWVPRTPQGSEDAQLG